MHPMRKFLTCCQKAMSGTSGTTQNQTSSAHQSIPMISISAPIFTVIDPKNSSLSPSEQNIHTMIVEIHEDVVNGNVDSLLNNLFAISPDETGVLYNVFENLTILHKACQHKNKKIAFEMVDNILIWYKETAYCTFEQIQFVVNRRTDNADKQTALHIAAGRCNKEIILRLIKAGADVNLLCAARKEPIKEIYKFIPEVVTSVYDLAINELEPDEDIDYNFQLKFMYTPVIGAHGPEDDPNKPLIESKLLTDSLSGVSKDVRSAVMAHPLIQLFVIEKWKKMWPFIYISGFLHAAWSAAYVICATFLYYDKCPNQAETVIPCNKEGNEWWIPLLILSLIMFVKDGWKLFTLFYLKELRYFKFHFFYLVKNLFSWVLQILAGIVLYSSIQSGSEVELYWWEYSLASVGIIIACWLIVWQMKKIPCFHIWIDMIMRVTWKITKALISHVFLFAGFSLALQLLMPGKDEFALMNGGTFKVIAVMTTGEMDYDDIFHGNETESTVPSPMTTKFIFLFLQTMLIMSFTGIALGIAIYDCGKMLDKENLRNVGGQLEQIYLLERFLMSNLMVKFFKLLRMDRCILNYIAVADQPKPFLRDVPKRLGVLFRQKIEKDIDYGKVKES